MSTYRDQEKGKAASGSKRLFPYFRVDKNKTVIGCSGSVIEYPQIKTSRSHFYMIGGYA
jgi:hypothetical protein